MFAAAKYSSLAGEYSHSVIPLRLEPISEEVRSLAQGNNIRIIEPSSSEQRNAEIAKADIVLLEWWNSPSMAEFLRSELPAARLAAWMHVGGHQDPQRIPESFLDFLDFGIACSPFTYEAPAFAQMTPENRAAKTTLAYGATDFARLTNIRPRAHSGFNVGYIGTVNFVKMHPNYISMSARVAIPDVRFIVAGHGGDHEVLRAQARHLGIHEKFSINDAVADIAPLLEILDVYGYPLCEDTYAASELTIQEAMYCGIPSVVFPYGGLKRLVINDFTGYVVQNEVEYAQALEYLYHNKQERVRIGRNAAEYARQIFGAETAARKLNLAFEQLLKAPKHTRPPFGERAPTWLTRPARGVQAFLDQLGPAREVFQNSIAQPDIRAAFAADAQIMKSSNLMKRLGIHPYRNHFASDPYLNFWAGLASFGEGNWGQAMYDFVEALKHGFPCWRPWWYLALAARRAGNIEIAQQAVSNVLTIEPRFDEASTLQRELSLATMAQGKQ
jgi:glycosyltransferase involved in cell wall biosynthesis